MKDLYRHGVRFVVYEHKHMSAGDCSCVEGRLEVLGFRYKFFGRDAIAWRELKGRPDPGASVQSPSP